jgi:hypothetical protein
VSSFGWDEAVAELACVELETSGGSELVYARAADKAQVVTVWQRLVAGTACVHEKSFCSIIMDVLLRRKSRPSDERYRVV